MESCGFRRELVNAKRVVVKVGTSTLTYENGKMNFSKIDKLVRVLADLINQDKEIILVTSGAVGIGVSKLKLESKPKRTREKQAVAAVGQCELMNIYGKFFSDYGHIVGQILLTKDVTSNIESKQNVVNTFETLLEKGIVPIVNENDSVAVDELENGINRVFGDNDTLSAIVSELVNADLLIILSDIDGLYNCDPRENSCSKLISTVENITPEVESCAGGVGTKRGTGGMFTKMSAAKIAVSEGINLVIANGKNPRIISDILKGKNVGTLFVRQK
ncbi:glutamate 5-kinase [Herbivorax sp. ANBcel31]|uniref:glutamate 5-kinase n=1 Tax=Herbivorax sp. ANBcel31 TaxID=3069754 RepID=UPI0027B8558D|nr:glutamate 5-kinase [Herbivorax sp. ANBcel31]MDQ2086934.1 glutamate 5-kinase [Herbivorax sp. ANBcel31]